ncbi:hypothetical protein LOK49_LG05G02338 [Camellia lanceoleosa]|uniref:Uncharacterized protein n=1 Tax=Camellia lanceoleosa TaxID=1840588 RepID=A0ACC0HKP5_9ERIC|nr:hypothetical protein LOK49_LG05G02338 [Camellia lanceoleosa]
MGDLGGAPLVKAKDDVKVGDKLLVDGGMVRFEVIEKIGSDVKCRCTDHGRVRALEAENKTNDLQDD